MKRTSLVTGAAGFIGSHLVESLLEQGWTVRALVRYNSRHDAGWIGHLTDSVDIHRGDIRDRRLLRDLVRGCDTVFHLAALIGIPYSYESPESYLDVNVQGTLNLLESMREGTAGRLLVTSTSEVYGTALTVPQTEEHPLQAQSPYAASKIAADQLALSYYRSFGTDVALLRPFNTFGPRQSERAIIPTIIRQILSESDEIHLGNLDPRRDMNYVSNTVDAFLSAADAADIAGETIHFGSGDTVSVGEMVNLLQQIAGTDYPVREKSERQRPEKSEVRHLQADASRAQELLGWTPRINLSSGLEKTWEWFRTHPGQSGSGTEFVV